MKKTFISVVAILLLCSSCHPKKQAPNVVTPSKTDQKPQGELAFLLSDNQKLPSDVGFLSNHIMERRLANLMKDSLLVLQSKTQYATPLEVQEDKQLIIARYFTDESHQQLSALVIVDVLHDNIWVHYYNGKQLVKFTDDSRLPFPNI